MRSNFSITTYHYKHTIAHDFDARLKFAIFLFLGIAVFFLSSITTTLAMFMFITLGICVAGINLIVYWKALKPMFFVFTLTLFFYYFFGNFDLEKYQGTQLQIALYFSTIISFKIYDIFLIGTLLILTTSELELSSTIAWYLHPLHYLKVPVNEISMIITLGLRFIPVILLDLKTILYAQETRGISYREGSLKERMSAFGNAFLPLFIVSFRRADDISKAMIARGYVIGEERSNYSKRAVDLFSVTFFLIAIILISAIFYVQIQDITVGCLEWVVK